jgi:predicted chitinase
MRAKEFIIPNQDLEEGWKDWAVGGAMALGALGAHSNADAKSVPNNPVPTASKQIKQEPVQNPQLVKKAVDTPQAKKLDTNPTNGLSMNSGPEHTLQKIAMQAGIKGVELAQFMAQVRHETADFAHMKEIGGSLDFKKYDPKFAPKKAKALGNKHVGDGAKFKGRGFIQITGRDNYRMAGQAIGLPLEEKPDLAAQPDVAAKVAVWYWNTRVKPYVNNFNDTAAVTKKINPGMRGLDGRMSFFQDYKKIIA